MKSPTARKRPNWQVLSWHAARSCWKKKVRGVVLYFGGNGKRSRESHDVALAEWNQRKESVAPMDRHYARAAAAHEAHAQLASANGIDPAEHLAMAADLRRRGTATDPAPLDWLEGDPLAGISNEGRWIWSERRRAAAASSTPRPSAKSLRQHADAFVDRRRVLAVDGQRSLDRADSIRCHLDHFVGWHGAHLELSTINPTTLIDYHTHVVQGTGSAYTKRDRMAALKQFLRAMMEQSLMPAIPNIGSQDLLIRITPGEVQPMPLPHLKALLKASSDRTRLYLLLMINAGMQQADIAALRIDQIDFKAGTITRRREKTRHTAGAPTITYPLFASTLKLLREHVATSGTLALLNEAGEPLLRRSMDKGGKLKRIDNIVSAASRVYDKLEAQGITIPLPLRHIRKTGATMLHEKWGAAVAIDYLADVPSGVLARHYVKPSAVQFGKAIRWMEGQIA